MTWVYTIFLQSPFTLHVLQTHWERREVEFAMKVRIRIEVRKFRHAYLFYREIASARFPFHTFIKIRKHFIDVNLNSCHQIQLFDCYNDDANHFIPVVIHYTDHEALRFCLHFSLLVHQRYIRRLDGLRFRRIPYVAHTSVDVAHAGQMEGKLEALTTAMRRVC